MTRMDDLLEAATFRFRYDAGLRQEIARELRAHLEDSIAAARADGMDEAQAEDAAVRAFGDPDEIGEKLWQANRRRMRRRAAAMAAVGVVLMPAGILAACWFIFFFLDEFIGRVQVLICIPAIGIIYLLTRLFLPKTARFGVAFLRWLPLAFGKSVGTAFRNAWIWAPALAVFGRINVSSNVITAWRAFIISFHSSPMVQPGGGIPVISLEAANTQISHAGAGQSWIIGQLLLFLVYLVCAVWIGRRLRSASGIDSRRASRWHMVFIVSALVGLLIRTHVLVAWLLSHHEAVYLFMLLDSAHMPFGALISALFLVIVLRRLRGQSLSMAGVLSSTFVIIGPMVWVFLIVNGAGGLLRLLCVRCLAKFDILRFLDVSHASDLFLMVTAFLPVIIVSEQCGLRRACVRLGDFVLHHLWRYMAFILMGALLLGLPRWAAGEAFGSADGHGLVFLWLAREAIRFALQLGLTVMCFEFYLTRAGTFELTEAEKVSSQVLSEGTR